ncbi:hypothetical protein [Granulicatella adiacens]
MKYREKKTGVVIESDSVLSGSWEPVEEKKKNTKTTKTTNKNAKDDE